MASRLSSIYDPWVPSKETELGIGPLEVGYPIGSDYSLSYIILIIGQHHHCNRLRLSTTNFYSSTMYHTLAEEMYYMWLVCVRSGTWDEYNLYIQVRYISLTNT